MQARAFLRPTVLRTLNESPLNKKWRWQRYAYIAMLVAVSAFIGYFYGMNLLYVYGNGYVMVDKIDVSLYEDAVLSRIHVAEGQKIARGEALFSYEKPGNRNRSDVTEEFIQTDEPAAGGEEQTKFLRDRLKAQQELDAKTLELELVGAQIAETQDDMGRMEQGVRLGIYSAGQLQELKTRLTNLQRQLHRLDREIEASKAYLATLKYTPPAAGSASYRKVRRVRHQEGDTVQQFLAPENGSITRLYKKPSELTLKGEVIMHLELNHEPYILAYFDQNDVDEITEGREVQIKFPNGRKSAGYLKRVFYTTVPVPAEFKESFKVAKRSIAAQVAPRRPEEAASWHGLYKMNVLVSLSRF